MNKTPGDCPCCARLRTEADNATRAEIRMLAVVRTLTVELKELKERLALVQQFSADDDLDID